MGISFTGIEQDERYFEIAVRRMREEESRGALLFA
jgi:hypothetical protein